jgi:hypothetical protein
MSGIDERIRQELKGLARPVGVEGVADEVSRRKSRRRVVRRAQVAVLAAVVVLGSLAGVYGLLRVFGPQEETPGDDGETFRPAVEECDASTLEADVNRDAVADAVIVYWPSETMCEPVPEGVPYQARVVLSAGTPNAVSLDPQDLPECETPSAACKAFGAPDVDGDGRAEVAIAIAPGGPSTFYALHFFDESRRPGAGELVRYTVESPGDPWHAEYGFAPGPAVFTAYGSVTHQHWVSCFEEEGVHYVVAFTALRSERDPHLYRVHSTMLLVAGGSLEVAMIEDEPRVPEDRLEPLDHLCGSPLFVRD